MRNRPTGRQSVPTTIPVSVRSSGRGGAIAWHLAEVLEKSTKSPFYRVSFHEITRSAIEKALSEKGKINLNLVDAQQARRVLDRIVGYQVSPLLWSRIEKGSSAGRVQSVALRLVVERERAIKAFQPEEYWIFSLVFRTEDGREFTARLFKIDGKDFRVATGPEAEALIAAVKGGAAPAVGQLTTAERKRNAPPPFTTSTLQQTANTVLHYSATNTMRYAQQLYEGIDIGEGGSVGLITYMRTDSVTIAREAQEAAGTSSARVTGRNICRKNRTSSATRVPRRRRTKRSGRPTCAAHRRRWLRSSIRSS